ncbi:hypothetical protein V5799_027437, partial [Amblyomma americanum]
RRNCCACVGDFPRHAASPPYCFSLADVRGGFVSVSPAEAAGSVGENLGASQDIFSKMSESHFDEYEHYNFEYDKFLYAGHSGTARTRAVAGIEAWSCVSSFPGGQEWSPRGLECCTYLYGTTTEHRTPTVIFTHPWTLRAPCARTVCLSPSPSFCDVWSLSPTPGV